MRLGILLLCMALVGCDGAAVPGTATTSTEPAANAPPPLVDFNAGSLALYPDLERDDKLALGTKVASVEELFAELKPKNHIVATPLPKGLVADDYTANGWESGDFTAGFGIISSAHTKEVVAAFVRQNVKDKDDAQAIIEGYKRKTPDIALRTMEMWDPLESTCRHASLSIL